MGRSGFNVAEQGHIVTMIAPISISTAATSEVISMENWAHCTIICNEGAGSSATFTIRECDNFTPSNSSLIGFRYYQEGTAAGDTLSAMAAAGTGGVGAMTASGVITVAEIDAAELSDGYGYLQCNLASPGTSKVVSIIAILSGGRYTEDITATVIV